MRTQGEWTTLADALAFTGNSLLAPMNQSSSIGLDPEFWRSFPDFGDAGVAGALEGCLAYAESAAGDADRDSATRASVEYTRLFVGPPKPTAAPWESAYRNEGNASVGFGPAAHEMRALLREAGLELDGPSNQYADHMGIELLYASVLCGRVAQAANDAERARCVDAVVEFCASHPLSWIERLESAVSHAAPEGYIWHILNVAHVLLAFVVQADLPK